MRDEMTVVAKTNTPWWRKGDKLKALREYRGCYVIVRRVFGFDEEIYHPVTAFRAQGSSNVG